MTTPLLLACALQLERDNRLQYDAPYDAPAIVRIVKFMLRAGADPNATMQYSNPADCEGHHPLHMAAKAGGHMPLMRLLLQHDAIFTAAWAGLYCTSCCSPQRHLSEAVANALELLPSLPAACAFAVNSSG